MAEDRPSTSRGHQDHIYHGEYFWNPQHAAPNDPNFEQFYDPNTSESGSNERLDGQNGNVGAEAYGFNEELQQVEHRLDYDDIPANVEFELDRIFMEQDEQAPHENPNAEGNKRTCKQLIYCLWCKN